MSTFAKRLNWRRAVAVILGLFAAYMFLDLVMIVVEEFPKRSRDPQPGHWWSEFIIALGLVFVTGCVALLGALRLWCKRAGSHT
jgi:hypothetical protein